MAERIIGQLSWVDSLVSDLAESVLDQIAAVVDWPALAAVLGSRYGAGPGSPGYPSADRDARWGRKGKNTVFGYKLHIGVDAAHTIIRRVATTDASITDTEMGDAVICGDEGAVYGDQAYYTHARHERLSEAGI